MYPPNLTPLKPRRSRSPLKIAGMGFLILVTGAAAVCVEAWFLMLLVGALHLEVSDKLPPFGFFPIVLILIAFHFIAAYLRQLRGS